MITLAVFVVLVTVAIPGYHNIVGGQSVVAGGNDLLSFFIRARSTAIKRGRPVVACVAAKQTTCTPNASSKRKLIAFIDPNGNGTREQADEPLAAVHTVDDSLSLTANNGLADGRRYSTTRVLPCPMPAGSPSPIRPPMITRACA